MAYKEPGIEVRYASTTTVATGNEPFLTPCIVGSGAKYLKKTITVERSMEGDVDEIGIYAPNSDFTVLRVGQSSVSTDYYDENGIRNTESYIAIAAYNASITEAENSSTSLALPQADYSAAITEKGIVKITWTAGDLYYSGATGSNYKNGNETITAGEEDGKSFLLRKSRKPDPGVVYYVDIIYPVNETNNPGIYELRAFSVIDDIFSTYGDCLSYADHTGQEKELNRLALGLYLARLNGASSVYGLQVNFTKTTSKLAPDQYDYSVALAKLEAADYIYRIVPLDLNNNINEVVINHVELMSSPEEKGERRAFLSYAAVGTINNFADLYKEVGGYASRLNNSRISLLNKYNAAIYLPSGDLLDPIDVAGSEPFICAAMAGREGSMGIASSLTKTTLAGFQKIEEIVPTMRTQRNMLAQKGVILLEKGVNEKSLTTIRHSLTTDVSSVEKRETAITTICDYIGKLLRNTLDQFVGKNNLINEELLTRIQASTETTLDSAISNGIIIQGEVSDIYQNETDMDRVTMIVTIFPPYPCNGIDITVQSSS